MSSLQNILPAILGFTIGSIWIVHKLGWLKWIKFEDKYRILIPIFVTITLPFIFTYISLNFNLIKELAQLGIFFTIAIAFLTYFSNQKTKRDEEITKQAILALKRSYKILTDNGKNIAPPSPDRLNWLTTARMLARYEKLKGRLKTDLYITICEEQEEYWRHRFYLLIKDWNLYPLSYFQEKPSAELGIAPESGIAPNSAVVIFRFSILGFPELDEQKTIEKLNKKLSGALLMHDGLIEYLKNIPMI